MLTAEAPVNRDRESYSVAPSDGWYDPDSVSFVEDRDPDDRAATADTPKGDYSPLNRGERFSMKAAIPSA